MMGDDFLRGKTGTTQSDGVEKPANLAVDHDFEKRLHLLSPAPVHNRVGPMLPSAFAQFRQFGIDALHFGMT